MTPFNFLLMSLKSAGLVANSVDHDQMLHSAASDLVLHYLLKTCVSQNLGTSIIIINIPFSVTSSEFSKISCIKKT